MIKFFFANNRKYFVILGGFLVHLSLGEFYSFSHIVREIVNYTKNNSLSGSSVNFKESVWICGLMLFGIGSSFTAGGFLEKKVGPSITVLLGGWLMSLNVALLYFSLKSYIWIVILSYGLFSGIGIGFAYGSALGAPLTWFKKNRGLITGLVVSAFGISQTIFIIIRIWVKKYEPNQSSHSDLPKSFLYLGIIYAFLQFVGSILLKNQPLEEEASQLLDMSAENEQNYVENSTHSIRNLFEEKIEMQPHQILNEFDFWILWMTYFLLSACVAFILQLTEEYATVICIELSENQLIVFLIVCDVFKFCGRIFWGLLIDKISYKVAMFIITILLAILMGSLVAMIPIKNKYVYGLWISLINILSTGIFSIFPVICARCFGMKYFICNYGMLYTAFSVSGLFVSAVLSSYSKDFYENHNPELYTGTFISCSVMSFIAAVLTLLFKGKPFRIFKF